MCLQLSGTVDTIDTKDDAVITPHIWPVETVVTRGCSIRVSAADDPSPVSQSIFTITEKAPTRAFSWLKVPTSP